MIDRLTYAQVLNVAKELRKEAAEIEEMSGNKQRIVVHSLPYQVNKANLIIDINQLARDKKVDGIAEVRDESDREEKVDRKSTRLNSSH